MAKINLSSAAKLTGASRSTLYRAVKAGMLTREPDGRFDTAELLRAGFELRQAPPAAAQAESPPSLPGLLEPPATALAPPDDRECALWERERELLLRELAAAQEREAASREREARLLQMLETEQQQRRLAVWPSAPEASPPPAQSRWRGWLRRRRMPRSI